MHCKLCNTRITAGERACPNCGADVRGMSGSHPAPAPRKTRLGVLSPPPLASTSREPEREVPLEEIAGRSHSGSSGHGSSGRRAAAAPAQAQAPSSPAGMGTASLRSLLAEQPELLEPGLGVYRDESGAPAGLQFSTGVGVVDLLATDARGNLVAVMVAEKGRGEEELVAEVLQRVGWLRKHLCEPSRQVRAIVLVEDPPASLPYTAAAVAETLSFKTYRVALVFEDVEI